MRTTVATVVGYGPAATAVVVPVTVARSISRFRRGGRAETAEIESATAHKMHSSFMFRHVGCFGRRKGEETGGEERRREGKKTVKASYGNGAEPFGRAVPLPRHWPGPDGPPGFGRDPSRTRRSAAQRRGTKQQENSG